MPKYSTTTSKSETAQQKIEEAKKAQSVECQNLSVTSNSKTYRVGDNAQITVKSPFHPCEGKIFLNNGLFIGNAHRYCHCEM